MKRNGKIAVSEEKLEDTMLDLINYSIILLSYYMYEQEYNMYNDLENGEKKND